MRDIEQQIRDHWFKEHIAILTTHGDLQVLQWKKPGTICYSCRYVFDGNKMYISGDIGEAVFWLTWQADVHSFNDIHIHYFDEKLNAYSGERKEFNEVKAVARLREWLNDLKEYHTKYDHDEMRELFDNARQCNSHSEWIHILHNHDDFISELDQDHYEWTCDCGAEVPMRVKGYLIGLKMASEQLMAAKTEGEIK